MVKIEVVVSNSYGQRAAYDQVKRVSFIDLILAFAYADRMLAPGLSVVVRPLYNEVDEKGKGYFREWRSFNGEELKEVRFQF